MSKKWLLININSAFPPIFPRTLYQQIKLSNTRKGLITEALGYDRIFELRIHDMG